MAVDQALGCAPRLMEMPVRSEWDALVLAGGRSARMGRDKSLTEVNGISLLERTLLAIVGQTSEPATRVIVSGAATVQIANPVIFCREDPPFSGPAAALHAALEEVRSAWIMILPCDLAYPARASKLLLEEGLLVARQPRIEALIAKDVAGHMQWLTAFVRTEALRESFATLGTADIPVKRLFEGLTVRHLDAPQGDPQIWNDVDTPEDLARIRKELS